MPSFLPIWQDFVVFATIAGNFFSSPRLLNVGWLESLPRSYYQLKSGSSRWAFTLALAWEALRLRAVS
ncbi:MAG: hypothetical protein ABI417_21975, partial [Coleofasciculaceae cyanobacterium]